MTRERWERIKSIFGDALEREPAEREAFIREAAGDDPELLSELLRLLEESDRESKLLSRPALVGARPLESEEGARFPAGTVLAQRFQIVRFIARGGMGEVYEAEDLELGERVALKAIRSHVAPDGELLALFKQEVQLARKVTHPNVCRIFDLARHEDAETGTTVTLLSMELLDGRTLSEHLRHIGPLNFRDALPIIEEIAAGLQAVHDAGIVHGDLKPANVMLAFRPRERNAGETRPHAVVMDFGLALPVTPTQPGQPSRGGTPDYSAPEQTNGTPLSPATDVYCFALMIADMLGVPRANRLRPDAGRMPARWARSLRRCLEGEPSRRYSRPMEVATALRRSADYRRATLIRVAAAALVVAVGIPAAIFLGGRTQTFHARVSRQILTEGTSLMVHQPSPDGRFVVATSWDTGDLILRDVETGKVQQLTHNPGPATLGSNVNGARFSLDGRQIAYEWWTSRTESELRVIGADGKGERTLYRDSNLHPAPYDWSPDGSQILISLTNNTNVEEQLAIVSVADGSLRFPPVPAGTHMTNVTFSSDANGLVFTVPKADNAGAEIHQLSFAGVESTLVTSSGNRDSLIGWSPDRRRLIFTSDRRGQKGIWAIAVSDQGAPGEPQELIPDAGQWQVLGITQTGSLLYRLDTEAVDVYTAVLDLAAGRTVSEPKLLMDRFVGSYAAPHWSEDGRLVALSKHDPRQAALLIYDPQRGTKRELLVDLRSVARPQWVEHGAAIMAVGTSRDGVKGLFRVDPSTGKAAPLMTPADLETSFPLEGVWSADSKIHFNRYRDYGRGIFRLNTETGERTILYVPPPDVDLKLENLALSPDGRTLAFHARSNAAGTASLMLLPAEGGDVRTLWTIQKPDTFNFESFTWTPDSRRILAAKTRNGVSELWQVPVDGSSPVRIEFPAGFVACLRLSPDGKTIAFQRGSTRSEIWLLQNFL